MKVMWKAVYAVVFFTAAATIEIGCGEVYRPIVAPAPVTTGNPSGAETDVTLNQCPSGSVCTAADGTTSASALTSIDVSGDEPTNNKSLVNQVGSVVGPVAGSMASPFAFDYTRTSIFTANTSTDSVTQSLVSASTSGPAATTATILLPAGSKPIGISFQYYSESYTQDYVVNSGPGTTCPSGKGSLGVITQSTSKLAATVCLGATPVFAWIYKDQSKVFVLDNSENQVYVVNASAPYLTHTIAVGAAPFKAAQSSNGNYVYVLNGNGSISIIDGQAETVVTVQTANLGTSALPIDIAQDLNYSDTIASTQSNHVWILHADGTVSVWDATTPGQLKWITSIATITPEQASQKPAPYPTNLALLRDGSWAYVGLGNTDQIVGINTSELASGVITQNATTSITVGTHRGSAQSPLTAALSYTYTDATTNTSLAYTGTVPVEVTTPVVTSVAVSREGNSAQLAKVYATTTTSTTYYCYDYQVKATDCSDANGDPWANGSTVVATGTTPTPPPSSFAFLAAGCTDLTGQNAMSCPNLYNGTSVVTAAANGSTAINTYVKTIPAPSVVTYCDPGNSETGEYDGQKNCPAMIPVMMVGRT